MKEVTEFIKRAGAFYLGTVDGDQPEVRPIGVFQEYGGRLFTAVGQHKKVYAQILKNPKIVICCMHENRWIRVRARAVPAEQEIVSRVFSDNPFLKTIYNDTTGLKLGVLELTDGEVEFCSIMGPDRTERL